MIQIEAIHIEEFRGIRQLDLTLGCKSFVVWGPNGSGKSGVVDAIDFAITGNITRLSGAGTGGLSVLKHGPHVHHRDNAAAAKVALTIRDTVSEQQSVLTRSVKTASKYTLEPDTPEMRKAVESAQQHPELTLSRREIIKYIVALPGERAQEVQALLKLDRLDRTRKLLRTSLSKVSTECNTAETEQLNAEDSMRRHLDVSQLLATDVAGVVNRHRATLGLEPLGSISIDTDLGAGISDDADVSTFSKASALRDVKACIDAFEGTDALIVAMRELTTALDELADQPDVLSAVHHRALVEAGLDLVSDAVCPLCDVEWSDVEALRGHLQEKIARSRAAAVLQRRMTNAGNDVGQELRTLRERVRTVLPYALAYSGTEFSRLLQHWSDEIAQLEAEITTVEGAVRYRSRIAQGSIGTPPQDVSEGVRTLYAALESIPDNSAVVAARTYLTVASERWRRVRQARSGAAKSAAAKKTAQVVYDTYCDVADESLALLYKSVEDEFSEYYRQINADDESSFKAGLEPSAGKLDLNVDFYGTGMFPPAAYHSEGHQDGMGVCLYLALVRQLLGDDFHFAVLDDVVMSVDSNHRRQFCRLLQTAFPQVQFIITTHDEVWARQMQSSGLISRSSQAHFHGWTVDGGPIYEQGGDVWSNIDADLANDDVPGAAHKLRRYLEAAMGDIAEAIGGQVPYRSDASHDLSELFNSVKGRHGDLLRKASGAANSWNLPEAMEDVKELKAARAKAVSEQGGENWAINKLVHNNDSVTMTKEDFAPVLESCRAFIDLFSCKNSSCTGWIYVVGQRGSEESLRCACESYRLNLRSK